MRRTSVYWKKRELRKRFNHLIEDYKQYRRMTPGERVEYRRFNQMLFGQFLETGPIYVPSSRIPSYLVFPKNCSKTVRWREWNPLPDGGYTTYVAELNREGE